MEISITEIESDGNNKKRDGKV